MSPLCEGDREALISLIWLIEAILYVSHVREGPGGPN
jgi:hypothetical protein